MNALNKALHLLGKVEEVFLVTVFFLAFLLLLAQAGSRYIFNNPIVWTDELSTTLQMIMGFLGIAYGIRHASHIKLDGLRKKLPVPAQHVVGIVINIVFIVVAIAIMKHGITIASRNWNINFGTMKIGKGKAYLAVPVGFGLSAVYTALDTINHAMGLVKKKTLFEIGEEGAK